MARISGRHQPLAFCAHRLAVENCRLLPECPFSINSIHQCFLILKQSGIERGRIRRDWTKPCRSPRSKATTLNAYFSKYGAISEYAWIGEHNRIRIVAIHADIEFTTDNLAKSTFKIGDKLVFEEFCTFCVGLLVEYVPLCVASFHPLCHIREDASRE